MAIFWQAHAMYNQKDCSESQSVHSGAGSKAMENHPSSEHYKLILFGTLSTSQCTMMRLGLTGRLLGWAKYMHLQFSLC